ncbi:MAG: hypothetical protein Q7J06_03110, partial [Bacteroidales bacterium]|nr:hypothetical protein [Bacteroidales bacterium]
LLVEHPLREKWLLGFTRQCKFTRIIGVKRSSSLPETNCFSIGTLRRNLGESESLKYRIEFLRLYIYINSGIG